MDNHSQSSDVFPESGQHVEDIDSLLLLISKTTGTLYGNIDSEVHKTNFPAQLTSALEDCEACLAQGFDFINSLLQETNLDIEKLQLLIEDAAKLLQAASCYVKNVVQYISMACHSFGCFPVTTANITYTVFTHCRDSETLYGDHLKMVENQLKNLFRTCHELQVTYLSIIDKHYTFDLSNCQEMAILVDALKINLRIGEIVQTLDVKTMAEQWKGYTMICEKYSASLFDEDIFWKTTKILCCMAENNIRNAVEMEQEEKIAVRSLKVASFNIKILLKVCNIFKLATANNYKHILELLLYAYLNSSTYLEETGKNSPQLINLMEANVLTPCEVLLKELLGVEKFVSTLLEIHMDILTKDDVMLGYIILILTVIKVAVQKNVPFKISKGDLINCVYIFLPYGHIWFNMGLKFQIPVSLNQKCNTCGLYEYTLTHVYALVTKLNSDEMLLLEEKMFRALLGLDSYCALFSVNLWSLIARISNPQYAGNQLSCLWKIYNELESRKDVHSQWSLSPQRTHFNYILRKLLHTMDKDRIRAGLKVQMVNELISQTIDLRIATKDNILETATVAMNQILEKISTSTSQVSKQIEALDKLTCLTSICSIKLRPSLGDTLLTAWMKSCPSDNDYILQRIDGHFDSESALYLDYIRSLAAVTRCYDVTAFSEIQQVKILHVVCCLIQHGNTAMKLTLINLFLELAVNKIPDDNDHVAERIVSSTFKTIYQENDALAKESFYNKLRKHPAGTNMKTVLKTVANDSQMEKIWNVITNLGKHEGKNIKAKLLETRHLNYVHKCVANSEAVEAIELSDSDNLKATEKRISNNFDFADIDTLFEVESDSEPASKKVKLNSPTNSQINEVMDVIARLENDAEQLCQIKENVFTEECKSRIKEVCLKLQGIAS